MKLLNFIINTNIFISAAAVVFTMETQVLLGLRPQLHPYLFIIFFATIFEYNLHRLITVVRNPEALNDEKHRWVKNSPAAFYALVAVSVLGFLAAALMAKKEVLIALFPIGLITLFYSLPVVKHKKRFLRLREIPGLKIFLIAFVWAASTIFLPIIQTGAHYNAWHIAGMMTERIVFVLAITLPFDIRDMQADEGSGLKTIPLLIGPEKATAIAQGLLGLFMILCVVHYTIAARAFLLPAFLLSAISTFVFIRHKKIRAVKHYHYFVLDGTMLLQGLLVCLSYYISY